MPEHATAYRVACSYCGKPVHALGTSEVCYPVYHGECWRKKHPPLSPPGPIGAYSHDERVRDGLEAP